MTSLTMYSEWTAPTMLSSMWTKPETKRTKVAHQVSGWVRVVDTTVRVFYPVGGHGRCRLRRAGVAGLPHADSTDLDD